MLLATLSLITLGSRTASGSPNASCTGRSGSGSRSKVAVDAGEVKARFTLLESRLCSGQRAGIVVDFDIAPGWHIYGKPLPEEYTPTSITFESELLSAHELDFPKPVPVKFELLDETLPVYQGHFQANGTILLRPKLARGEHRLGGTLSFQECNDNLCKMPQQVRFEIPLWIDSPADNHAP
jgi:DsbC/DsbD-like thiol-disulfide interchange protein